VQSWSEKKETSTSAMKNELINGLNFTYQAPQFSGIDMWFNSKPLNMASLKGNVVLVDFWTYSCINCIRTLPYITEWYRKYHDKGLVIVGVHAPEFEFEKNQENVKSAIAANHITYPVALDNNLDTWTNFNNNYWPAHYLIDQDGRVVYTHFGEGEYGVTENNIRFLLGLNKITMPQKNMVSNGHQTPETYLGNARAANFSRDEKSLAPDHWALIGKWRIESERIISDEKGAKLRLNFTARKVFLVMGSATEKPIEVSIGLNNKVIDKMTIDQHKLYTLIDQHTSKQGLIEITANAPGLEAYAFTFGE